MKNFGNRLVKRILKQTSNLNNIPANNLKHTAHNSAQVKIRWLHVVWKKISRGVFETRLTDIREIKLLLYWHWLSYYPDFTFGPILWAKKQQSQSRAFENYTTFKERSKVIIPEIFQRKKWFPDDWIKCISLILLCQKIWQSLRRFSTEWVFASSDEHWKTAHKPLVVAYILAGNSGAVMQTNH